MHARTPTTSILLLSLLCAPALHAQDHAPEGEAAEKVARHELSLLLAHTHLSEGVDAEGDRQWLVLPSWGLNYNYWLTKHWAIGLHTDFITENYVVKKSGGHEEEMLERSHPVAPAVMVTYHPHHHWAFVLGAGEEFAEEENLFLMRAGTEYTVHLSGAWETSGSLAYDFRFDAYDSWTLAFGVTRVF